MLLKLEREDAAQTINGLNKIKNQFIRLLIAPHTGCHHILIVVKHNVLLSPLKKLNIYTH